MTQDGVNPDLVRERQNASFDTQQMTYVVDGGIEKTRRRQYIENLALSDSTWKGPDDAFLSREERYTEGVRKAAFFYRKSRELGLKSPDDITMYERTIFPNEAHALTFQSLAFLPAVRLLSTPEQLAKWEPLMENLQIHGNYCQTELSHGSHVRGLQTTATYDPVAEEFILNTPNLEATKWWVGNLGKSSTHALVYAQLYTLGKNCGVQVFLVPIRDIATHQPLRGITVGDIGPKWGMDANDNGFMQMDNVRIPRENMLMRMAQVKEDGQFLPAKNTKMIYGGMLNLRGSIPLGATQSLNQAITIAIRYSCVRHQSELKPGAPEPQILDYQTQQYKLLPWLASSYAFGFASRYLRERNALFQNELKEGNTEKLAEMHVLSAGMKAYITRQVMEGVEWCRLSCGGHGYSQASGLPKIYTMATANVTAEGEATVLLLQVARFLMKCCMDLQSGRTLPADFAYLAQPDTGKFTGEVTAQSLVAVHAYRARTRVLEVASRLQSLLGQGKAQHEALNLSSVFLAQAAEAHCEMVIMKSFAEKLGSVVTTPSVRAALERLMRLYGIHNILQNVADFIKDGFMTDSHIEDLTNKELDLLAEIRPDAVSYVDAFDYPDEILQSVLGRYDGQVYDNLFKWAQKSTLNKTQVHRSFNEYLKPLRSSL